MGQVWSADELRGRHGAAGGRLYDEFLRVGSMSAGLYRLRAGGADPQGPHREDEVYVVLAGRATFETADARTEVGPGAVIFVGKGEVHRFVDIAEDLDVVVLFAPPESSGDG